jgi:catechol 2,3-dioxygenase
MPEGIVRPKFSHLGVNVRDLPKMKQFYSEVIGLTVSDEGKGTKMPVEMVFFSNDPDEHHQFLLVSGRREDGDARINQMSFRVQTIDEIRTVYDRARAYGVNRLHAIDHGNAISVYFADP